MHWIDFRQVLAYLEDCPRPVLVGSCTLLVAGIGLVDYFAPVELFLSIFYLIPIGIGAWFGGARLGYALSLLCTFVWLIGDQPSRYAQVLVPIWNGLVRLGFFALLTFLLNYLRLELAQVRALARTDLLTGAANRRAFIDRADAEIKRMLRTRRPLTLAYLDLDNFKMVNDSFGHAAGDALLCKVIEVLQGNTRASDVVARIGGDEFALLLPETDEHGAQVGLEKLRQLLLQMMIDNDWPVTVSIGGVTYHAPPPSVDALIRQGDDLMYAAKRQGKDRIRYEVVRE